MQAVIKDNQWIYLDQVVEHIEHVLGKEFSAKHPRANYINDTAFSQQDITEIQKFMN